MSDPDPYGLRAAFPGLEEYEVTSPRDVTYNCAAWADGRDDVWMWPDLAGTAFWPESVPREETVEAFVSAFQTLGYSTCESADLEPGNVKVALFEHDGTPTHLARQMSDGKWTSKCGQSVDISHELHDLEGAMYGRVAVVMSRNEADDR